MITTFETIKISELNANASRYVKRVENTNRVIYIVKNSKIVAKLSGVSYEGEIK